MAAVLDSVNEVGQSAISVRSVSRSFVRGSEVSKVLDGVDVDLPAGSFTSIVGPSGCGKTTLLRIMAGLRSASSGEVAVFGRPISGPPADVIYVFQQYAASIFPWRTVEENVEFGLEVQQRMSRSARRELAHEYLELVGLDGKEHYYPGEMSGGMQQRLALARALVCRPKVLLMDEPFSAVDALTRIRLQSLVTDLWRRLDLTIVFVTHDIDEAVFLSTRVLAFGPPPSRIELDLPVALPFPRSHIELADSDEYRELRRALLNVVLGGKER